MAKETKRSQPRKTAAKRCRKAVRAGDKAAGYNRYKLFNGKQYTGMQIGRSHHWNYDKGDWKETKITPDLWEISYTVTKRRKGKAPPNSGAPVGTGYQWYILAHQHVEKLNANDYSTDMAGLKFKLAHRRADKEKWSVKAPTQRKHLVQFLKEIIAQLESDPIPLEFEYESEAYKGEAVPLTATCAKGVCYEAEVTLNDEYLGIIRRAKSGWKMDRADEDLAELIGELIMAYFGEDEA
ncbi:hypothetical protein [Taibaiella helva]|uniref:hypothetical protein n=1 Tax=Taibaiella helva TaxID=2301235 RepID=UPI0018E52D27|nr:hypothetical protein [Taibaiella helva]